MTLANDDVDRRTAMTLLNGVTTEYAYDTASQLTSLTYRYGPTVMGDLTYTYDVAGNRTGVGGTFARTGLPQPMTSASYDEANQLLQWGQAILSYDANGHLTSDGLTSYGWNARNQLAALTGPVSASFGYDAFERRRSKTVGGTTTEFLYDGLNAAQELSGGMPIATLLTGLNVDEYLTRTDPSGTLNYLTDALGSSIALADGSGTVQAEYAYEPFGVTTASGSPSGNTSGFTGREIDGTGLYYYRARYYNPTIGRFLSEDPLTRRRDPFPEVPARRDRYPQCSILWAMCGRSSGFSVRPSCWCMDVATYGRMSSRRCCWLVRWR